MATTTKRTKDVAKVDRYLVISSDGHVGPSVKKQLRPYCEKRYLSSFDQYADQMEQANYNSALGFAIPEEHIERIRLHGKTLGLQDPHARLSDMDTDGIAAEVLFHGGINGQSIPFSAFGVGAWGSSDYKDLEAVGYHVYNRWLADYVSAAPQRLIGIAHIPTWDIEASVREIEWAKTAGLGAVNLPSQRRDFPGVNEPLWEPIWSVCEAMNLPLMTHGGGGDFPKYSGIESTALWMMEQPFFGRRNLWYLIFSGVFERHPHLKFVISEQFGDWVPETLRDMQSAYLAPHQRIVREGLPRTPLEYWEQSCFVGASFMAAFEAQMSVEQSYDHKMLWGSDYPHTEGTWPRTRAAMKKTFSAVPTEKVRAMLGGTAATVFDLDIMELSSLASDIGPSVEDLSSPPAELPDFLGCAFRDIGKFA